MKLMKWSLWGIAVVLAVIVVSPAFAKAASKIDTQISGCPSTSIALGESVTLSVTTTPAGLNYEYSVNGGAWTYASAGTPIVITDDGGTSGKTYTVQARAVHGQKADASPAVCTFYSTPDTAGPTSLSIDSGPEGTVNTSSVTFTFSSQDPDTVRYGCLLQQVYSDGSVSGGTYSDCTSPKTYSDLADGNYRFWVAAFDASGNPREVHHDFTVDTGPQVVASSDPYGANSGVQLDVPSFSNGSSARETVQTFVPSQDVALSKIDLSLGTTQGPQPARVDVQIWEVGPSGSVNARSLCARTLAWDSRGATGSDIHFDTVTAVFDAPGSACDRQLQGGQRYGIALERPTLNDPILVWEFGTDYANGALVYDDEGFRTNTPMFPDGADGVFKVYAQ